MEAGRRCPSALRHLTGRNTPVHRPCPPSAHALQNAASASASSNRPSHPSIACRTAAQPRPTSPFNDREKKLECKLCIRMVGNQTLITNPEDGG